MVGGEWVLEYTGFDSMENHSPEYQVKIPLLAGNQEDALKEIRELRQNHFVGDTYRGYNGQIYPQDLRVSYSTSLDPNTLKVPPQLRVPFEWKEIPWYANERELRAALVADLGRGLHTPTRTDVRDLIDRSKLSVDLEAPQLVKASKFYHTDFNGRYTERTGPSSTRWDISFLFRDGNRLTNIIPDKVHINLRTS